MGISGDKLTKYHTRKPGCRKGKGNLKRERESLLIASQNNAIKAMLKRK